MKCDFEQVTWPRTKKLCISGITCETGILLVVAMVLLGESFILSSLNSKGNSNNQSVQYTLSPFASLSLCCAYSAKP